VVVVHIGNRLSDCVLSPQLELLAGPGLFGGRFTEISWGSVQVEQKLSTDYADYTDFNRLQTVSLICVICVICG
jgi:hypothetical protein